MWHLSRFEAPDSSLLGGSSFNDHFDPILAFFAPFYRLWPDARVLIIIQQLLTVFGAVPVYLFARKKIKQRWVPPLISFLYLYFIGIQSALSSDYHSATIAAAFISWAIYLAEVKIWRWYWWVFILSLLVREDVAIYLFALGIYLLVVKKEKKIGGMTVFISLLYYYLIFNLFLPLISGQAPLQKLSVGTKSTASIIVSTLLTSPLEFITNFFYPLVKLRNIFLTLFSFGFLPLLSPLFWLLAPVNFVRHLAADAVRFSLQRHYAAPLTPILTMAAVQVLAKIKSRRLIYLWAAMAITGTLYTNRPDLDPGYPAPPLKFVFKRSFYVLPPKVAEYQKMLALIPATASVSAQVPLLAHLTNRDQLYKFPQKYDEAEYIALSFSESFYPMTPEGMEQLKNKLLSDSGYAKVYFSYFGVVLAKR